MKTAKTKTPSRPVTAENSILVFVYGTLKRGYGNNRLLKNGNAEFIGNACTESGFRLYAQGIPFMVRDTKNPNIIKGELWRCNTETLDRLDSLEGHPYMYRRESISAHLVTDTGLWVSNFVECETYIYQRSIERFDGIDIGDEYNIN